MTEKNTNIFMPALVTLSVLVIGYQVVLASLGFKYSDFFVFVSNTVFISLVALWIEVDSRRFPEIYRPYEFSYLICVYWIFYVPYYFWRTRRARGVMIFVGLILLSNLGSLITKMMYGAD